MSVVSSYQHTPGSINLELGKESTAIRRAGIVRAEKKMLSEKVSGGKVRSLRWYIAGSLLL